MAEDKIPYHEQDVFSEEEAFLDDLANDKIVEQDLMSLFAKQGTGYVAYKIEGFYKNLSDEEKEKGKEPEIKSKRELSQSPPTLEFQDNLGNGVELILTKGLSRELEESLKVVNKAYMGIQPKKENRPKVKDFSQFIQGLPKTLGNLDLGTTILSVLVLILIIVILV